MKRIAAVFLAVVLAFSLSACGEKVDPEIQKKNEETLAEINKDYVGQYLGDGTYQYKDITYKVNQNLPVSVSSGGKSEKYSIIKYDINDTTNMAASYTSMKCDVDVLKNTYGDVDHIAEGNDFISEIRSIDEIVINSIECVQMVATFKFEEEVEGILTYIPCGDGSLMIELDCRDDDISKYKKDYDDIISSIKRTETNS